MNQYDSFLYCGRMAANVVTSVGSAALASVFLPQNPVSSLFMAPVDFLFNQPIAAKIWRNGSEFVYDAFNRATGNVVGDHTVKLAAEATGHAWGGFSYWFLPQLPIAHSAAAYIAPFVRTNIAPTVCSYWNPTVYENEPIFWQGVKFFTRKANELSCPEQAGALAFNLTGMAVSFAELWFYLMVATYAKILLLLVGQTLCRGIYNAANEWMHGIEAQQERTAEGVDAPFAVVVTEEDEKGIFAYCDHIVSAGDEDDGQIKNIRPGFRDMKTMLYAHKAKLVHEIRQRVSPEGLDQNFERLTLNPSTTKRPTVGLMG